MYYCHIQQNILLKDILTYQRGTQVYYFFRKITDPQKLEGQIKDFIMTKFKHYEKHSQSATSWQNIFQTKLDFIYTGLKTSSLQDILKQDILKQMTYYKQYK